MGCGGGGGGSGSRWRRERKPDREPERSPSLSVPGKLKELFLNLLILMASSRAIEDAIFALLHERKRGGTICPSEVARRLAPQEWRGLMQPVREAAARLAVEGRLMATQKGKEVDALTAHGPIRLKALRSTEDDAK